MQVRHYRLLYDGRDSAACAAALGVYRRNRVAVTADLLVYHYIVNAERIFSDTLPHAPDPRGDPSWLGELAQVGI